MVCHSCITTVFIYNFNYTFSSTLLVVDNLIAQTVCWLGASEGIESDGV